MTWTAPAPTITEGPLTGPDRPILEGFLSWERETLLNICAGLTAEQLALRPLASSNLSLLGIVRHLTKVERTWFRIRVAGQDVPPVFDPALGKDYDFDHIEPAQAESAFADYLEECRLADAAVTGVDFDFEFDNREERLSLRLVYVHMIAEYSRHNGHADLIREAIDGVTDR
jgi:hypothetical protein